MILWLGDVDDDDDDDEKKNVNKTHVMLAQRVEVILILDKA